MKHCVLAILIMFLGTGCGSLKSKKDFVREDLEDLKKAKFRIDGLPFSEAKRRLYEFAGRCLNFQEVQITQGGRMGGKITNSHIPSIDQEGQRTVLYLAFDQRGSFGSGGAFYAFVSRIWPGSSPNSVEGMNYYQTRLVGIDWEETSLRLIPWLKGEKKVCPELPH